MGKPALPSWFKEKGPASLALLWAAASGEVIDDGLSPKVKATAQSLAHDIDPKTRMMALDKVVERLHGKVKDVVEVDGSSGALEVLVALARATTQKE